MLLVEAGNFTATLQSCCSHDGVRLHPHPELSPFVHWVSERFTAFVQVAMPGGCFPGRQLGFGQHFRQVSSPANLFVIGNDPGHWLAVFKQHKSDVLIMSPINAISEIARGLGDTDCGLCHTIRSSYFKQLSIFRKCCWPAGCGSGVWFRYAGLAGSRDVGLQGRRSGRGPD